MEVRRIHYCPFVIRDAVIVMAVLGPCVVARQWCLPSSWTPLPACGRRTKTSARTCATTATCAVFTAPSLSAAPSTSLTTTAKSTTYGSSMCAFARVPCSCAMPSWCCYHLRCVNAPCAAAVALHGVHDPLAWQGLHGHGWGRKPRVGAHDVPIHAVDATVSGTSILPCCSRTSRSVVFERLCPCIWCANSCRRCPLTRRHRKRREIAATMMPGSLSQHNCMCGEGSITIVLYLLYCARV